MFFTSSVTGLELAVLTIEVPAEFVAVSCVPRNCSKSSSVGV